MEGIATSKKCTAEQFGQCCCQCRYRINVWSHPHTDGLLISNLRGYICCAEILGAMSGWSEHGLCECFIRRTARPEQKGQDQEKWDNWYGERKQEA